MQSVDQTIDFMDHVRATGCAFALDDFGAGATGFRYFRDFRFDMVKIDGAFVRGVHARAATRRCWSSAWSAWRGTSRC